MTRRKVKLAYISNDSARKATFKKRKKGLIKKVSELSTLCDVHTCAIIYGPYDSQPEVWPTIRNDVHRVLDEFKHMPKIEQSKKMDNQESFLKHRLGKAIEHLKKLQKENREKEITCMMYKALTLSAGASPTIITPGTFGCNESYDGLLMGLRTIDLKDIERLVDRNIKDIDNQIEFLVKKMDKNRNAMREQHLYSSLPQGVDVSCGVEINNSEWPTKLFQFNDQMEFGGERVEDFHALWSSDFFS